MMSPVPNDKFETTNTIIKAEIINAQSHGLARLKMYCDRLKKGLINCPWKCR